MKNNVSLIKIKNVLGIVECEFKAGKFTTISGGNGTGKTSVMNAIRYVFDGGHDGTLLHKGAEKGEIVLILEDGTNIKKTITSEKSVLTATGQKKPKTYVDSISDLTSVNPISFLVADDATRLKILLESMKIELPEERLKEITGEDLPEGAPLVVLDKVRKIIYDKRTGENRAIREKQASIKQLEATLPDAAIAHDTDIQKELEDAEKEYAEKCAKRDEYNSNLANGRIADTGRLQKEKDASLETARVLRDDAIQKARNEYEKSASVIEAKFIEEDTKSSTEYTNNLNTVSSNFNNYAIPKQELIAQLKEAVKHEAISKNTRMSIENQKLELATFEDQAKTLSSQIDEIDKIKADLLSQTPFPNVQVSEGIIYVDSQRFNHLNTAQQVLFALKLAKLRAGDCPIVCLDGMECLDDNTLHYFKEAAAKSDLQFIITRVSTDAELSIKSE